MHEHERRVYCGTKLTFLLYLDYCGCSGVIWVRRFSLCLEYIRFGLIEELLGALQSVSFKFLYLIIIGIAPHRECVSQSISILAFNRYSYNVIL